MSPPVSDAFRVITDKASRPTFWLQLSDCFEFNLFKLGRAAQCTGAAQALLSCTLLCTSCSSATPATVDKNCQFQYGEAREGFPEFTQG